MTWDDEPPRPGFSLFVEQVLLLYDTYLNETDIDVVITRCQSILDQLRYYDPAGDDEEINIETAIELFQDLLDRAQRRLIR